MRVLSGRSLLKEETLDRTLFEDVRETSHFGIFASMTGKHSARREEMIPPSDDSATLAIDTLSLNAHVLLLM